MEKILVTGSNGFVGKHLMKEVAQQGFEPVGLGREESPVQENDDYAYYFCDLSDKKSLKKIPLENVKAVINLAGLAAVGPSFDNPELYMKVNVEVLTNLCDYVSANAQSDIRIIAISSGAVYKSQQQLPLHEDSLLDPESSPYAASKIAMEEAADKYRAEGNDCIVVRPFNHIGPGQDKGFLLPDLLAKMKELDPGEDKIRVGNLKTKRDYTDVRDVAKAYVKLAANETLDYPIYNVCSGEPTSGEAILELLKQATGNHHLETIVDENLFRHSDSPILYGDNSRIKNDTEWQPTIPLEQTIQDFVAPA